MNDLGCHYVEPVYNPEAILDYYFLENDSHVEKPIMQDLIMKAKQHLAAVGWTFRYVYDKYGNRRKVQYVPPDGSKKRITLRTACQFHLDCENGGDEIECVQKGRKKRKVRYDDEENVGKIQVKDLDRNEERNLCLYNRQFSFDDFEMEDGVKVVLHKLRALHLENGGLKFHEFESDDSGNKIGVGKTKNKFSENAREKGKTENEDANQKMDHVIEVHEISEEEEVQEMNIRNVKKKRISYGKVDVGKTKFNALKKQKRRIDHVR